MSPLAKLPDSQVFSRDPESFDEASEVDLVERMTAIAERLRKARGEVAAADQAVVDAKAEKLAKRAIRKPRKKKAAASTETPEVETP